MSRALWIIPPTLLTVACQRPELEAYRRNPAPVQVVFKVPAEVPNATAVGKEYAAALRAHLATRVMVVPDGVPAPPDSATLTVAIEAMGPSRPGPHPAAVGVAVGIVAGTLSALAGNRDHVFHGFWWGARAAGEVMLDQHATEWAAGFRPTRVDATFTFHVPGSSRPVCERDVNPREVMEHTRPLRGSEAEDPYRVREEEARAFAHVVVQRLQDYFEWHALAQPSYYRAPGQKAPDPDEPLPKAPETTKEPEATKEPETTKL